MGCGSCGSSGAPGGCQSHGNCSSGGCNRMNVYDWLADLPVSDMDQTCKVIEVSFNNGSRKDFFRNTTYHHFSKGDMIALEGVSGFDVGMVNLTGELVRLQLKKNKVDEYSPDLKKILRIATEQDLQKMLENKAREKDILIRSRAIARQLKLELKMAEVEVQADGRKATFFYIADDRVDFRELIKLYAGEFKLKVEMRQIGARQEAGKVGGIGSCGRELCCSTWLTDFKSVNTNAARYQNLSINQIKLSGQCGRLKCCLNYELDTYLDALQFFPTDADVLEVEKGRAFLVKKDIFRNLMWYTLKDSNKHYPLTIETVKKIRAGNREGIRPATLEPAEIVSSKPKEVEPEYADLVGQISLKSLERTSRKRREKSMSKQNPNQSQQKAGSRPQQNQPNQQNRPKQQSGPNTHGQNQGHQSQQQKTGGRPQQNQHNQQNRENRNQAQNRQGNRPPNKPSNKPNSNRPQRPPSAPPKN